MKSQIKLFIKINEVEVLFVLKRSYDFAQMMKYRFNKLIINITNNN